MWYDSKHVEIRSPKEWYNAVADQYNQSHEHLNSFYRVEFLRFLPRWKIFRIIDLWAWDGRMFLTLNKIPHTEITACDIWWCMRKTIKYIMKHLIANLISFAFLSSDTQNKNDNKTHSNTRKMLEISAVKNSLAKKFASVVLSFLISFLLKNFLMMAMRVLL